MGHELKTEFHVRDDILIRTLRDDDADNVFAAVERNRGRLTPFMVWATPDYTLETAREFIVKSAAATEAKKSLGFGIFRSSEFIGSIGFVKFDWAARKTEIGYWIDMTEEGKGIVSAACRILIEYAFGELDLNRVEIRCAASNLRSAAIPERLDFRKEGVLRQSEIRDGELLDFNIYGMLANEWNERHLRG